MSPPGGTPAAASRTSAVTVGGDCAGAAGTRGTAAIAATAATAIPLLATPERGLVRRIIAPLFDGVVEDTAAG